MTSMLLLTLLLAFLGGDLVQANCSPYTDSTASVNGEITDIFHVEIEAAMTDKNVVEYLSVTYDQRENMIRLKRDNFQTGLQDIIYNFMTQDKIIFDVKNHKCTVETMDPDDSDLFFLGGMRENRINSPLAFVHLTGASGFESPNNNIVVHKVEGENQARAHKTTRYTSCQKWTLPKGKFPVTVTVDLSSDSWDNKDSGPYPVRINIANDEGSSTRINRTYNFFNFRGSREATAFDMRDGFVCAGLKSVKDFPKVPPYLSYGQEVIASTFTMTSYSIFDTTHQFMMFDTISSDGKDMGSLQYRDYKTGLAYMISPENMRCYVANISMANEMPFDYQQKGMVKQMTPEMFFDDPANTNFFYMGHKFVRGIDAESWIAQVTIEDTPAIVEWYFAANDTVSWNLKTDLEKSKNYRIPLMRKLWMNNQDKPYSVRSTVHLYDVEFAEPRYSMIALESCFKGTQLALVSLVVPMTQDDEKSITQDINRFQWATAKSLATTLGVNLLRISEVSPVFYSNEVEVEFILFGPPPYASDVPKPEKAPLTLQEAIDKIQSLVSSGNLNIVGADAKQFKVTNQRIISASSSAEARQKKTTPQGGGSSGYTGGAMAGLGIAMLIIGGAGGGLASYRFINV